MLLHLTPYAGKDKTKGKVCITIPGQAGIQNADSRPSIVTVKSKGD